MSARPVVALVCMRDEDGLADYLERRGYDVREAVEDWAAASLLAEADVDVAVIGDALPASLALDLLRGHAREGGPSFVMVSDRADLIEKVLALELGAADVVPATVNWRELAARIGGLVARRGKGRRELVVLENTTRHVERGGLALVATHHDLAVPPARVLRLGEAGRA